MAVQILAPGFVAGLAACLATVWARRRTRSPQALIPRLPRRRDLPLMLKTALAAGAITFLTPLVEFQAAVLQVFVGEIAFENSYKELLVLFTLLGASVGLMVGILRVWRTPVADVSAGTPYSTYRADRRAARLVSLFVGAVVALGIVMVVLIESPFKDATLTERLSPLACSPSCNLLRYSAGSLGRLPVPRRCYGCPRSRCDLGARRSAIHAASRRCPGTAGAASGWHHVSIPARSASGLFGHPCSLKRLPRRVSPLDRPVLASPAPLCCRGSMSMGRELVVVNARIGLS